MEIVSKSPEETLKIALNFAASLKTGDVVAFKGGLGAGKTTFIKGIAKGLGYDGLVNSPTYSLVNVYPSKTIPLVHFDFYRMSSEDDLITSGFFDYLEDSVVVAVEWSENLTEYLPQNCIFVEIKIVSPTQRKIIINETRNDDDCD